MDTGRKVACHRCCLSVVELLETWKICCESELFLRVVGKVKDPMRGDSQCCSVAWRHSCSFTADLG